jgi:mRNA interferase HigB
MWKTIAMAAKWNNLAQLKADIPSADYVRPYTVFNVRGNKYRLIAVVDYEEQVIVVRDVVTHAAYSKGNWK